MNETLKQSYINMVDFLAGVLGENYEIVLHEISEKGSSVVAIKNSHISGRSVGAPLTDFALNVLKTNAYENREFELNYKATAMGKRINGSTFFIKESGKITGMLCVNYDDSAAKDALLNISKLLGVGFEFENKQIVQETLSASVEDMIASVLEGELDELLKEGANLKAAQKEELIARLYKHNIFSIKSAVAVVSKMFKISEPTIYRYLKNIK